MINYEQAKQIATKILPKADRYLDTENTYVFYISNPTNGEEWDNEVIVQKKDGKIISHFQFIKLGDEEAVEKVVD